MSAPTPQTTITTQMHEQLITRLAQADLPPTDVARDLGLTLEQLASWAAARGNTAILECLARLADIRAELLLSQYRANAAVQLIQIAAAQEPSELSRKACVDLLAARLDAFKSLDPQAVPASADQRAAAPSEDAILGALERLARQSDDGVDRA